MGVDSDAMGLGWCGPKLVKLQLKTCNLWLHQTKAQPIFLVLSEILMSHECSGRPKGALCTPLAQEIREGWMKHKIANPSHRFRHQG